MKLFRSLLILVAALFLCASCNRKDETLSLIPADAQFVAHINFKQILSQADFRFEDGNVIAPDYLAPLNGPAIADALRKISNAVDLENVFVVIPDMNNPQNSQFAIMRLTDAAQLCDAFEIRDDGVKKDGFTVYGNEFAVKDGFCWVTFSNADILQVAKKSIADAKKKSLADISGVAEALSSDSHVSLAILQEGVAENNEPLWGIVDANLDGKDLKINGRRILADGKLYDDDAFADIDKSVLQFAPADAFAIAAFAFSQDWNWDTILNSFYLTLPYEQVGYIKMFEPYIKALDGTVLVSTALKEGTTLGQAFGNQPNDLRFIVMAHMQPDMLADITLNLQTMLSANGVNAQPDENGMLCIAQGDSRLYIGNNEGYLTLASFAPAKSETQPLADKLTVRGGLFAKVTPQMLGSISLPPFSLRLKPTDEGVDFIATVDDTDDNFLPTIIKSVLGYGF